MNARRFATMTGSLLARKGEASPSVVPEDPNAPITWTTDPLVKQTELRVMAFPKRDREVEPATMHHEWPEHIELEPEQPMHDLREVAAQEPVRPVSGLRLHTEPEPVRDLREYAEPEPIRPEPIRPVRGLREYSEPEVPQPRPELRAVTLPEPVRPVREVRVQPEPEPARPAEPAPDRRSFFSDQGGEKRHRMSLGLTQEEHERLGIVAVKKGLTRHQLMRDALDHYFEKLANDYKAECACIATGGCKNGCDPEE
jgi:hypothetical protein